MLLERLGSAPKSSVTHTSWCAVAETPPQAAGRPGQQRRRPAPPVVMRRRGAALLHQAAAGLLAGRPAAAAPSATTAAGRVRQRLAPLAAAASDANGSTQPASFSSAAAAAAGSGGSSAAVAGIDAAAPASWSPQQRDALRAAVQAKMAALQQQFLEGNTQKLWTLRIQPDQLAALGITSQELQQLILMKYGTSAEALTQLAALVATKQVAAMGLAWAQVRTHTPARTPTTNFSTSYLNTFRPP